tara:strand:+ start:424 stop:639 length:216 start_codon:yes stop_codon:yes gene_type:complete
MKIPQQPNLLLNKPRDATPEEALHWQETDLNWWADRQLKIVAIMSGVQVGVFLFMILSFYTIAVGLDGVLK